MSLRSGRHILTINLEDYFQLAPLSRAIPQRYWARFETRVEKNTLATLDLLDEHQQKAVFFAIGSLAEQCPDVLREVVKRGHTIGSKGFYHRSLAEMPASTFREDAVRSRVALEKACGEAVNGYRIARGWFTGQDSWALDILADEGFEFDSSMRPIGLSSFGKPAQRTVFRHEGPKGGIWEIPLSACQAGPFSLPVAGGNYIRQFPDQFMRNRVANWVKQHNDPLVFYFHVWELDPDLPRISGVSRLDGLRQYRNLEAMPGRLRHYLETYRFDTPAAVLGLSKRETYRGQTTYAAPKIEKKTATCKRQPVTIAIPCFNEADNLVYLSNTLRRFIEDNDAGWDFSFVFVNDGSDDKTADELHKLFGAWKNTQVISHERNRGVAAATLTGIRAATTEVVCVLDADCSYDPAQLTKMVPMLTDGIDLVTASPYHPDGAVLNVPAWRLFISRSVSRLYHVLLNNRLATYTACVRVYRRSRAAQIKTDRGGYLGITEILVRLDQSGAKIVECPAILEARVLGSSKMKIVRTIGGHLALLARLAGWKLASLRQGRRVGAAVPFNAFNGSD